MEELKGAWQVNGTPKFKVLPSILRYNCNKYVSKYIAMAHLIVILPFYFQKIQLGLLLTLLTANYPQCGINFLFN